MENSSSGQVKWTSVPSKEAIKRDAGPKYSRLSESLRHAAPGAFQCSMFCGGKQCKYENPTKFKSEEMAVQGLYSSWVTSDILATARPSSEIMKNYKIIEQFKKYGIKSIINLQHPDEHASCGSGVHESGFSYEPEEFMQAEIFYYNFNWNDYGVRSLESILDMVKVMSFALQEGKTAVHCHAGLGRTGVLIACYLVYAQRLGAEEAIHVMRKNRPKAVQTRGQIECVKDFHKFLNHLWVIFPSCQPGFKSFTLQHYLTRQKHILHGMEARELKNLPKIVCATCSRLLELASVKAEDANLKWRLPVEVKQVFSEPEEESASTTDGALTNEPQRNDIPVSSEITANDLKHNPYVEADISALQRSQIMDDADDDDEAHRVCLPVGSRMSMMSGIIPRSRAQSEPNIYQRLGGCSLSDAIANPPLSPPGGIHGIRLDPLDLDEIRNKGKRNTFTPVDEDKVNADAKNAHPSVDSPRLSREEVTQAPSDSEVDRDMVARALAASACADSGVQNKTEKLKRKLNSSDAGWDEVKEETDPWVLSRLLWTWLEDLEEPVLGESDVYQLKAGTEDPVNTVKKLKKSVRDTLECLVTTVWELEPITDQLKDRVLRRVAMVLTHDRRLPLTSTRASLDRMASTSSAGVTEEAGINEQNNPDGEIEEDDATFDDIDSSPSVTSSTSYQLLLFLRQLIRTLIGQDLERPQKSTQS